MAILLQDARSWRGCSGLELRALLAKHQVTQKKAAEMIGVDPRSITRWLSGEAQMHYAFWFTLMCKLHPRAEIKDRHEQKTQNS